MAELYNDETGERIASRLRVCSTPVQRARGLIGTHRLDDEEAVWILDCKAIHSFLMTMTIDVAFLDGELRVVKVMPGFSPWRVCLPVRRARSVLEGPVGMLRRGGLRPGVRVRIRDDKPARSG